ncbi:Peroxidase [Nymphon striatum]|nr:Peroxidase [Nymphon striatum]
MFVELWGLGGPLASMSISHTRLSENTSCIIVAGVISPAVTLVVTLLVISAANGQNHGNGGGFRPIKNGRPHVARPSPLNPNHLPNCALVVSKEARDMILELPNHTLQCSLCGFQSNWDLGGSLHFSLFLQFLRLLSMFSSMRSTNKQSTNGDVCITYRDINRAADEARQKTGRRIPKEIRVLSADLPTNIHVHHVSDIVIEASRILARRFGLSYDVMIHKLPLIDTTKTIINDICPVFLKPVKCEVRRYRTLSGMCNNLNNPSWGATRSSMVRYLPPKYADGLTEPRRAKSGGALPSPRVVSFVVHQDVSRSASRPSALMFAFGQLIDHDLTLGAVEARSDKKRIECCDSRPRDRHPACMVIDIPGDDPFYKFYKKKCMDFSRTRGGLTPYCTLGPKNQLNSISSYIDGGFIYGSTTKKAAELRTFRRGQLKSLPVHRRLGLKSLLPQKHREADVGCERPRRGRRELFCFDAGDGRVNEQMLLTIMHTMMMRYHNKIADGLEEVNSHWDDETLFQESRNIMVALLQHVTYKELLPMILGPTMMDKYGLELVKHGYYTGYDPKVNPGIRNAFQAAAFRFGHSLLTDTQDRYNKFHQKLGEIKLSEHLERPFDLYRPGAIDTLMMGMVNQEANAVDDAISTEVTNHLFEKENEPFGMDLVAINMQRGRDHGLPGYNDYREYCGLGRFYNIDQLTGIMPNHTVHRYKLVYKHVDDIDLWSGGVSEFKLPDALIGPTFACLIAEQFSVLRRGDRFWYENKGWVSSFTPGLFITTHLSYPSKQLEEIRKFTMCRMMCDTGDDMDTLQRRPMEMPHETLNPRVSCFGDDAPPLMDLTKWRDIRN